MTENPSCKYAEFSHDELAIILSGLDDGSTFINKKDQDIAENIIEEVKHELTERGVKITR